MRFHAKNLNLEYIQHTFFAKNSPRWVYWQIMLFRSEMAFLVTNRLRILFTKQLACINSCQTWNQSLDILLYLLWFETLPRLFLFLLKNFELDVPANGICLVLFFIIVIDRTITKVKERNNVFWNIKILSIVEFSHSASLCQSDLCEKLSEKLKNFL